MTYCSGLKKSVILKLWFTTVKGYKSKSAKGKDTWVKVQKKLEKSFQMSHPGEFHEDVLNYPSKVV